MLAGGPDGRLPPTVAAKGLVLSTRGREWLDAPPACVAGVEREPECRGAVLRLWGVGVSREEEGEAPAPEDG